MKALFENKILTKTLIIYAVLQFLSIFIQTPFLLYAYEICYLTAIVIAIIWTIKQTKENNNLQTLKKTVLLFLVVNLGLLILYIPTILLNPSINGSGGSESDPMILILFFPPINFLLAFILIGLTGLITKATLKGKMTTELDSKT